MDLRGACRPKSYERRYAGLSESRKGLYYLFRRHLGFTHTEVDDMPWWLLRLYLDGLHDEFVRDEDDEPNAKTETTSDLGSLGITTTQIQ